MDAQAVLSAYDTILILLLIPWVSSYIFLYQEVKDMYKMTGLYFGFTKYSLLICSIFTVVISPAWVILHLKV